MHSLLHIKHLSEVYWKENSKYSPIRGKGSGMRTHLWNQKRKLNVSQTPQPKGRLYQYNYEIGKSAELLYKLVLSSWRRLEPRSFLIQNRGNSTGSIPRVLPTPLPPPRTALQRAEIEWYSAIHCSHPDRLPEGNGTLPTNPRPQPELYLLAVGGFTSATEVSSGTEERKWRRQTPGYAAVTSHRGDVPCAPVSRAAAFSSPTRGAQQGAAVDRGELGEPTVGADFGGRGGAVTSRRQRRGAEGGGRDHPLMATRGGKVVLYIWILQSNGVILLINVVNTVPMNSSEFGAGKRAQSEVHNLLFFLSWTT